MAVSMFLNEGEKVNKVMPLANDLLFIHGIGVQNKANTFYLYHVAQQKEVFRISLPLEEGSWLSIQGALGKHVLLSKYSDPAMPITQGLFVFDIEQKAFVLSYPEFNLMMVHEQQVLVRKQGDDENIYMLDLQTSNIELVQDQKKLLNKLLTFNKKQESVIYPYHIGEDNALYADLKEFVKQTTQHSICENVEYMENASTNMLLSYYVKIQEKLNQYMLVTNKDGNIVYHEVLQEAVQGMSYDVFMVIASVCVCVKHQNEICFITL
jgi:hypothetical protein